MYISLYDLGMMIMLILAAGVSVYVILLLHRLLGVASQFQDLLRDHDADLRKIVSQMPETLENINSLAVSLKTLCEHTDHAVNSLQADINDTVDDLRDSLETFSFFARSVSDVVKALFSR